MTPRIGLAIALLTLTAWPAFGQDKAELPRVLILGDQIYNEPARSLGTELKGKIQVTYTPWPQGRVLNSSTALELLDHSDQRTVDGATGRQHGLGEGGAAGHGAASLPAGTRPGVSLAPRLLP